jgi:putative two-component system response regulator
MEKDTTSYGILVVDDDATNLRMLQEILKPFYKVYAAPSGERALGFLENRTPDLIILDVEMPVMSGYELIKTLKEDPRFVSIPVIFLTAQEGSDKEEEAFRLGAVDYILKPITTGVVRARVNLHVELEDYRKQLEKMVEQKTEQLLRVQDSILDILANVTSWRDSGIGGHIDRTMAYTSLVVKGLAEKGDPEYSFDPPYGDYVIKASKLHDIGKVAVPDNILLKPGKLTPEEFAEIKKHTTYGARIIDDAIRNLGEYSQFLHVVREIVITHHEWWNGSGYPNALSGIEIPATGRVMAVSDIYDTLTSERPYKDALSHKEAMTVMWGETGRHFDPRLMELLKDTFPLFEEVSADMQ